MIPLPKSEHDWIEDYKDEDNGCYQHSCEECGAPSPFFKCCQLVVKYMNCKRCKVKMVEGKALQNRLVGSPDFLGDTGRERGSTQTRSGKADLIPVWKCPKCGQSVTRGE